jgi:capsular polysaccharide biosynthesis protein
VDLRDYVIVIARNWIIVGVTVAVGLLTAGVLAFTATTKYTASAQVLFTGHATTGGQDLAYVGNYVQSRMQTYKNLGSSTSMLESVIDALGTDETTDELADRTEITVSQISTVATVTATDTKAKGAARTANTMAAALLNAVKGLEAENADTEGSDAGKATATIQGVITGEATEPSSPSDPNIPFYLLAGLLAGLVVSVGVVALREVLTNESARSSSATDP